MKKLLKNFWPIIFIVGIWIAFSFPYFFQGKVPYPSAYQVNNFHPWQLYEKFWGPVKNGAMPDIIVQIYPWKHFTIETLKKGQIPLWNPYNFSGNPHLANFQTAVLSPFNLLYFVLPFLDAWSIVILLQSLLAGIFTYLLLREFGVSKEGSLMSGIVFMFCGFIVVWMEYGTLSLAISFLPFVLLMVEKIYKKIKMLPLFLLSVVLAISLFSGHFQTSLYLLLFLFAFIIYKAVTTRKKKETIYAISFFLFGILLSLPQLLPSIEFYEHTVRSEIFNKGAGIPWHYLVTIFAPDFFGNPVTRNDWFGYYAEWSSFLGIIPLVLAVFALFSKKKNSVFFVMIGITALVLALDTPLQNILSNLKIPVISTSIPSRIIVLFSFSFAVLAGFGFDTVKNFIQEKQIQKMLPVFLAFGALLLLIWILVLGVKIFPAEKLIIARNNLVVPTGLFLIFAVIVLYSITLRKKWNLLFLTIIGFVIFDSFMFANTWVPFESRSLVHAHLPVIDTLQKETRGVERVFGNLGAQVETYYGIPSIEGYDPLYIQAYGEFARSSGTGSYTAPERSAVKLGRSGENLDTFLNLVGVSYIYHPISDTNQGWAYPVWNDHERFEEVFKDDRIQIFKNNAALNRVHIFSDYEVIQNRDSVIKRFYSPDFDFRNKIILDRKPSINTTSDVTEENTAKIISYTPNEIIIQTSLKNPGILFLSDNYYPGWNAYINGKKTEVLKANYIFRAVPLSDGDHEVTFLYEPESFRLGIVGSIAGVLWMI